MSRVVVPLVEGFEDIEALTIVDILRRAEIDVVTAAVSDSPVLSSHNIPVGTDTTMAAVKDDPGVEMVVLPGGPGTGKLGESADLKALVERLQGEDKEIAAICAAPSVLAGFGVLDGKRATSFPAVRDKLIEVGVDYRETTVVRDGKVTTSRGPGTAMDFALELVAILEGRSKRDEVESRLMRPESSATA
ncbi:DJ-1 family glyoxalase III [Thiohalorhabdus methylotrophus]|uniref:DJ-1 family glyoxalase III n=1 Tax=Thiohalorhabdus methylotrophus TaxID=3242694 RepID=A0ABV4TR17_9GAMM